MNANKRERAPVLHLTVEEARLLRIIVDTHKDAMNESFDPRDADDAELCASILRKLR